MHIVPSGATDRTLGTDNQAPASGIKSAASGPIGPAADTPRAAVLSPAGTPHAEHGAVITRGATPGSAARRRADVFSAMRGIAASVAGGLEGAPPARTAAACVPLQQYLIRTLISR